MPRTQVLAVLIGIGIFFLPVAAYAQNVCSVADAECTSANLNKPCICVQPPGITLTGLCVAVDDCQEAPTNILSSIGSWIAAHPLLSAGIGLGAGVLVGTLLSSGSSGSSDDQSTTPTPATAASPFEPIGAGLSSGSSGDSVASLLSEVGNTQGQILGLTPPPTNTTASFSAQPQVSTVSTAANTTLSSGAGNASQSTTPAGASTVSVSSNSASPSSGSAINPSVSSVNTGTPLTTLPQTLAANPASVQSQFSLTSAVSSGASTPVETLLQTLASISSGQTTNTNTSISSGATIENNVSVVASAAPVEQVDSVSLPLIGYVDAPGSLWGNIQLGSTSAMIMATHNGAEATEALQFYGVEASTTAAANITSVCTSRPWATSAFSSIIPPAFFDELCTSSGY